jgi:hypothetical protein
MPKFTMEKLNTAYLNIAELLKAFPDIRGVFRRSWFLDPNLKEISPGLRFLWEVPQQNGADLFQTTTTDDDVKNAITMSPLRQKLYEEGTFRPATHAYVWPRKEFLLWANNMTESR